MALEYRPFDPFDLIRINLQDSQIDLFDAYEDVIAYGRELAMNSHLPVTVMHNDEILMIAGAYKLNKYVAEGYFLLSRNFATVFPSHAMEIVHTINNYLDNSPFHRVQCTCRTDLPEAKSFVELFGFVHESELVKFNPDGSNSYMMVKIR
jgi:hypothetical protein